MNRERSQDDAATKINAFFTIGVSVIFPPFGHRVSENSFIHINDEHVNEGLHQILYIKGL